MSCKSNFSLLPHNESSVSLGKLLLLAADGLILNESNKCCLWAAVPNSFTEAVFQKSRATTNCRSCFVTTSSIPMKVRSRAIIIFVSGLFKIVTLCFAEATQHTLGSTPSNRKGTFLM